MSETTMPATEASVANFDERNTYEFAFHVLPTVAEGEVANVYEEIKKHIAKQGEIIQEEVPLRVDLAYPIIKSLEGKNRKFTSAYFGWVRFKLESEKIEDSMEELEAIPTLLRTLLIKLTTFEEAHPFRFHENRKSVKMIEVVNEEVELLDESHSEIEENVEVSEKALDESLEKITNSDEKKE